jgi:hypothetical protein
MMHVSANQKAVSLNLQRYNSDDVDCAAPFYGTPVGALFKFANPVDPPLETACFQPPNLSSEILVSKFA